MGCRSETLTPNGLIIPGLLIVRASQAGCKSETLTSYSLIIPGLFIVRASQVVCKSKTLTKSRVNSTKSSINGHPEDCR